MTPQQEEQLAELLERWEQGESVDDLADEQPQLADEFRRRVTALQTMSWMDDPV